MKESNVRKDVKILSRWLRFLKWKCRVFYRGCGHLEDVTVDPPVKAETVSRPAEQADIVGANPRGYYAKLKNRKGIFSFFKEGLKIKKG